MLRGFFGMRIKNRHRLKHRDITELQEQLSQMFSGVFIDKNSVVESGVLGDWQVVLVDDDVVFVRVDSQVLFTLNGIEKYQPAEKFVVVDMGAVRFVVNGADVMTPGIVGADTGIVVGDPVWVCDEKHRKPLAVGWALVSGEEMVDKDMGKAVKNVHFVGDELWKLIA